MYEIRLSPAARRDLERELPERVAAAALEFIRGPLAEDPHRVGKPLRNALDGMWSARRGEYRVIYSIDDETVTVSLLRIAHRRDAYRT